MKHVPLIRIVDDDASVRDALSYMLELEGWDVAAYPDAWSFLKGDAPSRRGVLVLDVRMPGMSGVELQDELIRRRIRLPIIFLSGHGDIPMAVQAVKKGAFDFLQKPVNTGELVDVIRKCLETAEKEDFLTADEVARVIGCLTPRERQVVDLLLQGLTNSAMAARLGLSVRTVENHREAAYRKIRVNSLSGLKAKLLALKP